MGTIYFIQPVEYLNTNIFKIGCSGSNNLNRCKYGYGKGTRFISINQ